MCSRTPTSCRLLFVIYFSPGCAKLTHLEAESLSLRWPYWSWTMKYYNRPSVPIDSGFVAALAFLPELAVLITEVGARAVEVWNSKLSHCDFPFFVM